MKSDILDLAWQSTNGWYKLILTSGLFLFIVAGHAVAKQFGIWLDPINIGLIEIIIACLILTLIRDSQRLKGIRRCDGSE